MEQEKKMVLYLEQIENRILQGKLKAKEKLKENSERAAKCTNGVKDVQRSLSMSIDQLVNQNQIQLATKTHDMIKHESRRLKQMENKTKRIKEMLNTSFERVRVGRDEAARDRRM